MTLLFSVWAGYLVPTKSNILMSCALKVWATALYGKRGILTSSDLLG